MQKKKSKCFSGIISITFIVHSATKSNIHSIKLTYIRLFNSKTNKDIYQLTKRPFTYKCFLRERILLSSFYAAATEQHREMLPAIPETTKK